MRRLNKIISLIIISLLISPVCLSAETTFGESYNNQSSKKKRAKENTDYHNNVRILRSADTWVTIDYLRKKKPPVTFPHKRHVAKFGVECKTCHHTMKEDDETPKACSECHKAREETNIQGVGTAPPALHNDKGTKNIFHDRCTRCHKEENKGPEKCNECHPK